MKKTNIIDIKPVAYIKSIIGIEFIIEIKKDKKNTYAMVLPINYEIKEEYPKYLVASAIAKHDYIPYEGESYSYDEYKDGLKSLAKKLK